MTNQKNAPREYWLEKDMFNQAYVYEFNPGGHRDIIHTIEFKAYQSALELIGRLEKALNFGVKIFDDKADGMGEVACIEHMMRALVDIKKFRDEGKV